MLSILNERFVRFDDGREATIAEIAVDTKEELPGAEALEKLSLCQGSLAWVIGSGAFYALNGSGKWVDQDSGDVYTPTAEG